MNESKVKVVTKIKYRVTYRHCNLHANSWLKTKKKKRKLIRRPPDWHTRWHSYITRTEALREHRPTLNHLRVDNLFRVSSGLCVSYMSDIFCAYKCISKWIVIRNFESLTIFYKPSQQFEAKSGFVLQI